MQIFVLFATFSIVIADYSCPVRIISNNAHSSSSSLEDDPENLLAADDSDGLPEGGEHVQPFSNNTGFFSSEHFAPSKNVNFKCQFIFLAAPNEHVQVVFRSFRLFYFDSLSTDNSSIGCEEQDHISAHVLVGSRMSRVHDFCRSELPPTLMSSKNLLTLDYVVKSIGARIPRPDDNYGFTVEYRFLHDYGSFPPEAFSVPNTSRCLLESW
jgi:hypothetical protein